MATGGRGRGVNILLQFTLKKKMPSVLNVPATTEVLNL